MTVPTPWMREHTSLMHQITIATNHTTLLCMPNEILAMIAGHADKRTLRSMRLTCSRLCEISTETFGKTQLSTRRFVFSEVGVCAFYELTSHPKLGRYLRSVEFSTFRLDLSLEVLLRIARKRFVKTIARGMGMGHKRNFRCSEVLEFRKIRKYTSDEAAGTPREFPSRFIDNLLICAFRNLAVNNQDGTRVNIGIYDDFAKVELGNVCFRTYTGCAYNGWATAHQKGYGWRKLYDNIPRETWQHHPEVPLDYIRRALQAIDWKPSLVMSLQAFTGEHWAAHRFYKQTDVTHYLKHSGHIDSLLEGLLATLSGPHNARKDVCVKDPLRMIKLHGKTACLEFRGLFVASGTVSLLEVPIFPPHREWGAFNNILLYPCLEELCIESCTIRATDLVAVLAYQQNKLKKVRIARVTLIFDYNPLTISSISHWEVMPLLLDAIQMFPQLEAFSLDHVGLADVDRRLKMILGYDVYEEIWEGRQVICDRATVCAAALRAQWDVIEDIDHERRRRMGTPTNAAFLARWFEEGEQTEAPMFYDCSGQPIRKGLINERW